MKKIGKVFSTLLCPRKNEEKKKKKYIYTYNA